MDVIFHQIMWKFFSTYSKNNDNTIRMFFWDTTSRLPAARAEVVSPARLMSQEHTYLLNDSRDSKIRKL